MQPLKPNPKVFFDIEIGKEDGGSVVFELFADKVPITAENFKKLSCGEAGRTENGNLRTY